MEKEKRLSETSLNDFIKTCRKTEKRGKPTTRKSTALRPTRRPVKKTKTPTPKPQSLSKKLEIKNCHVDLSNKEIYDLFAKFGTLTKCKLLTDEIGRSKGVAIVEFENADNAKKATEEYNQKEIKGNKLDVKFVQRKKTTEVDRKKKIGKEKTRPRRNSNTETRPGRRRLRSQDSRDGYRKNSRDNRRNGNRGRNGDRDERGNRWQHDRNRDGRRGTRGRRYSSEYGRGRSNRRY